MTDETLPPDKSNQSLAKFNPPALEMFERYSSDLVGYEYDDHDEAGKPITKRWLETIGPNTKLIPKEHCRVIKSELEDALVPATYDEALALTKLITGRYTEQKFNDVGVFVAETARLFSENPVDLGFKAADKLRSKTWVPNVGDVTAVLTPLVEERRLALRQVRLHLAEHERGAGKVAAPGELPEQIRRFKSLAPAIKAAVGDEAFNIFWPELWLVSDDGETMVVAQPSSTWRDKTAPHVAAIGKVAGRAVELVIRSKPAAGSRKAAGGPRPIGDVVAGADRDRHSGDQA